MIEAVKKFYEDLNAFDVEAMLAPLDPGIERVEFEGSSMEGRFRGLQELRDHFEKGGRARWAEGGCYPERFEVHGPRVVAFVHVKVRLKGQDTWNEGHVADVFTFRNGKITEFRTFADAKGALDWARR